MLRLLLHEQDPTLHLLRSRGFQNERLVSAVTRLHFAVCPLVGAAEACRGARARNTPQKVDGRL